MPADALRIARFCDLLTNRKAIADFPGADNGLQHRGKARVRKVGAAVDAGAKVFELAARRGVDFLIVHHGMRWRPVSPEREVRRLRLAALKKAGLSLYSSHLPLDAHPVIGNNALIAADLGLKVVDWFVDYEGLPIACSVLWLNSGRDALNAHCFAFSLISPAKRRAATSRKSAPMMTGMRSPMEIARRFAGLSSACRP